MQEKRMRIAAVLALALMLSAGIVIQAHQGHDHSAGAKAEAAKEAVETFNGEVLDLSCYLGHGAKGQEHQKCAKDCLVKKMVPAGLLTPEGIVYLLVEDHKFEKAFKPVRDLAAEQVKVTGTKVTKGGLQAIMVQKVEKAGK